ncbi:MAG TPA: LysR family transcriptional regulator [Rhizomicrobium sp.]|nr:LysR family transcriptional regulator [Rhizomicrobium sp.]
MSKWIVGTTNSVNDRNLKVDRHLDNPEYSKQVVRISRRMVRIQLAELTAFVAVAEHRSFTKAATQVGIALPTMSQTIRLLEERLGVRLFNRTTRSVALTETGERLLAEIQPVLESIDHALETVNSFRDKPMGTLRLALELPATAILQASSFAPLVQPFLAEYPAIRIEIMVDDTNSDIVSGRFDAGIRLGQRIERDMTVLKILDEFQAFAVASPDYLARHPKPSVPQDLHDHNCIRYRYSRDGSIPPWVFTKGKQRIEVAVDGSLVVNDIGILLSATLDGVGVSYQAEPMVGHIAQGRLVPLLEDWSRTMPGIFLYHPSRRQPPMPLKVFLNFIEKWRKTGRAPAARAGDGKENKRKAIQS